MSVSAEGAVAANGEPEMLNIFEIHQRKRTVVAGTSFDISTCLQSG